MTNSDPRFSAESAEALRLLAAEDERQDKLQEILETIREQIRLEIQPENRPDRLFKNIQDAVYAMRGRTRLSDDAAITHVLNAAQPVAWTNEHQLGYLKDPEWASVPMAMWGKSNGAARIPLYAAQPPAAPVETAVSSDGEPSNGKQPLMASRPAPPVPSDPQCSAGNGGDDLVERLRTKHVYGAFEIEQQRQEAANEIDRLRTLPQAVAMPLGMKAHPNSGAPFNPRDDDAYPKDDGMAKSSAVSRPEHS